MTELVYNKNSVAALFDQLAANQPAWWETRQEQGIVGEQRRRAFEALDLQPDDILLDAGCGLGGMTIPAAKLCKRAIGFDISRKALEHARRAAVENGIVNAEFHPAALEEAGTPRFPTIGKVNKILVVNSLSHLPDDLKAKALRGLAGMIEPPGRLVIGDLMLFEPAELHREVWDEVGYDGGLTDFATTPDMMGDVLRDCGAEVTVERLHPLLGVMIGEFTAD